MRITPYREAERVRAALAGKLRETLVCMGCARVENEDQKQEGDSEREGGGMKECVMLQRKRKRKKKKKRKRARKKKPMGVLIRSILPCAAAGVAPSEP